MKHTRATIWMKKLPGFRIGSGAASMVGPGLVSSEVSDRYRRVNNFKDAD